MVDFSLREDAAILNNDIDLIKQQIEILFDTDKMEVLGDSEFGTHYEEFLYDLKMSTDAIEYVITSDLNKLQLFEFIPTVTVSLFEGTENDIILVKIDLSRNNENYNITFKIS